MALFDERIIEEIHTLVAQRYCALGTALGSPAQEQECQELFNRTSILQEDLKLLIGVANGEYRRTDELVDRTEQALTGLMNALLGNALHYKAMIPDEFWRTDIGVLVSRVRWWISVDELITISNAAALAFGENTQANRMRIARAIDRGVLEWVPDPSIVNPQQNKRVLRSQVEHLRDQRHLPEE